MTTQNSDAAAHAAQAVVLSGDERLIAELSTLLAAHGFEIISADNERAIKAAAPRLAAVFELTVLAPELKKERLAHLDALVPARVPLITSSVTVTALAQSQYVQHPERLIGFCGFPTISDAPLIDIATTFRTSAAHVRSAREFFSALGKETVCVQDRTGMIVPAMAAQIVNEALMAVQQNVASARDIDTAMKLGAGYALGPIEWGEKIGFNYVLAVLEAMRRETGEARFRTSALLRQLAAAGTFWHAGAADEAEAKTPEAVQEQLPLGDGAAPAAPQEDAAPNAAEGEPKKKRAKKRSAGA